MENLVHENGSLLIMLSFPSLQALHFIEFCAVTKHNSESTPIFAKRLIMRSNIYKTCYLRGKVGQCFYDLEPFNATSLMAATS